MIPAMPNHEAALWHAELAPSPPPAAPSPPMARHIHRTVSLPPDLDALRALHAADLPDLSALTVGALRAALEALGVELPPPPPPTRTTAATRAAAMKRATVGAKKKSRRAPKRA